MLQSLLLAAAPTWGLLVIRESGRPAGSVYPILERLERSGWVTSERDDNRNRPGPRRRLYELTGDGASAARQAVKARPALGGAAGVTP